jgi:excisionase family DNA binding protein
MLLPLAEAAELANVSRSALLKAIKRGKLSAARDDVSGQWRVDAAELSRVYAVKSAPDLGKETPTEGAALLNERVRALEHLVDVLEDERNDLRRRLDAEADERRRLTRLLTHQREVKQESEDSPRTSLMDKLFGRR